MSVLRRSQAALLCAIGLAAGIGSAHGADLLFTDEPIAEQDLMLPAVSGINGKWELDGGLFNPGGTGFRAAGSLSIPLGDRFGAQGDVMLTMSGSDFYLAGAGHLFTRDPSSYLLGVTAGVVIAPGATLTALGAEGELYLDRISLEGWAGLAAIDYADVLNPDLTGLFAIGDIAFYPMDDLRLAIGASSVLGDNSLHFGAEYQLTDFAWPLSLTADARIHGSGNYTITAGLKGYLGPTGESKSLIDRHRQDDPPNRAVDLTNASMGVLNDEADEPPGKPSLEELCNADQGANDPFPDDGGEWVWDDGEDECIFEFDNPS